MAAQSGQAIVVSTKNAGGTYEAIAGLRTRSIRINSESVDTTNADSSGRFRELLDAAGVNSVTIAGDGVLKDNVSDQTIIADVMAGTIRDRKMLLPNIGTFEGPFKITAFESAGAYNKELTYSFTFESAGAVTFTAAV